MRKVEVPTKASMFTATQEIRINVWGAILFDGIVSSKEVSNSLTGIMYLEV